MSKQSNVVEKKIENIPKSKPIGRPRVICPPHDDLIALGQEMIEFLETHPDILHIQEWYSIEKMILYKDWKNITQKPEFFPYYEKAMSIVGRKYIDKKSDIRDSISHRFIRHYFKHVKEEEDEQARFIATLKQEQIDKMSDEDVKRLDDMITSLKTRRQKSLL